MSGTILSGARPRGLCISMAILLAGVAIYPSAAPYAKGMDAIASGDAVSIQPKEIVDYDAPYSPAAEAKKQAPQWDSASGGLQRLEDVLRHAYLNNPTLRAARAELRGRDELLPQAQSGWMPSADAGGAVTRTWLDGDNLGADGATTKEFWVGMEQPIYRGGRTVSGTNSALDRIYAQQALLASVEQDIMRDVATSYMDVHRALSVLDLVKNNLGVIDEQLRAARERFDAGEATRTDVSQSEARLARARADVTAAEASLQKSRAVYEQLTGMKPGMLGFPQLNIAVPADGEQAADAAEENHPMVLASRYFHDAAEHDVEKVFGELLPYIAFQGRYNKQFDPQPGIMDRYDYKMIGVRATIPLYEGGGTRSRVRQAKHAVNQRHFEILETKRAAREEAVRSWQDLVAAKAEIRSREAQINAASIAREGVRQETLLGLRTILDSLNADQEYLDAQVALATAQRDEIVAHFALLAATGRLTPETLGFGGVSHDPDVHLQAVDWKMLGMDVELDKDGT